MDASTLLTGYDLKKLTVGSLGGHSALDVCHGAKKFGFPTIVVARKGRERTYTHHFRSRGMKGARAERPRGCVDDVIVVDAFNDILKKDIQRQLRECNTIFVHSRYFWVYIDDFASVEKSFAVPIFGSRSLLKLEERDQPFHQLHLLQQAGIRTPKLFKDQDAIDRTVIVKAHELKRGYERAFFIVNNTAEWYDVGGKLERSGKVGPDWRTAPIEEFIVGAPVNFNFFHSPLSGELELLGTDMRRQTNLDGFLRMTAPEQQQVLNHVDVSMVETGHVACTVKESLLEQAFTLGEKFVAACKKLPKSIDPDQKGIIGPFALQGAVVAEDGREDIVIFDVSFRIPGSPGVRATPYSGYLYGESMSVGERIGMELRRAVEEKRLEEIVT